MRNVILCFLILSCAPAPQTAPPPLGNLDLKHSYKIAELNNVKLFNAAAALYKRAAFLEAKANLLIKHSAAHRIARFKYNEAKTLLDRAFKSLSNIKTFTFKLWKQKKSLEIKVKTAATRIEKITNLLSVDWNNY